MTGVAVGSGLQSKVAVINLVCYYGIGLPVGIVLGYWLNLGVQVSLVKSTFSPWKYELVLV